MIAIKKPSNAETPNGHTRLKKFNINKIIRYNPTYNIVRKVTPERAELGESPI